MWVLLGLLAWVLLSVPLAFVVGASLEHGERIPRQRRRFTATSTPTRPAKSLGRLAS